LHRVPNLLPQRPTPTLFILVTRFHCTIHNRTYTLNKCNARALTLHQFCCLKVQHPQPFRYQIPTAIRNNSQLSLLPVLTLHQSCFLEVQHPQPFRFQIPTAFRDVSQLSLLPTLTLHRVPILLPRGPTPTALHATRSLCTSSLPRCMDALCQRELCGISYTR
jgi:hypothetical protein